MPVPVLGFLQVRSYPHITLTNRNLVTFSPECVAMHNISLTNIIFSNPFYVTNSIVPFHFFIPDPDSTHFHVVQS